MAKPDYTKTIRAAHATYRAKCYVTDTDGGWECRLHEIMGAAGVDHNVAAHGNGESAEEAITSALAELHEQWDAE